MSSRRKFLKTAAVSSAIFGSGSVFAAKNKNYKTVKDKAVVVSIWDFRQTANLGAWEILGKGGRALDAVEQV